MREETAQRYWRILAVHCYWRDAGRNWKQGVSSSPFLLPCNVLPDLPVGKTKAKATRQKDIRKADLGVLGREGQKWDLRRNRRMASTQRRHPFTDSPSSPTFGTAPRGKLNQFSVYQFHDSTILKIFFLFQTSLGINLNN